ncbi:diguanylate cyclase [Halomonas campisalis]|uniref:diguanylate cyclase n=1 Tax=Billgrantia campisalis TaxID=74661 RepID=A0ABS9PD59_9GAMM|nr:sensor domain-containing diguanylate cyclase [Halomonas campisalis]MCG6659702.1 diguanylate cyclase [Halomonas campisalis]MDR5864664.1 diguanylate cyclase [Halomonas campisalis]
MSPPPPRPTIGGRHSLTAKQAALTLVIALLLSVIAGGIELASDARTMRQEVQSQTRHMLDLVQGTAAEAAFQLNPELAAQVADGLVDGEHVARVVIRDDFERIMAARGQAGEAAAGRLTRALFGDSLHYHRPLTYQLDRSGPADTVGEIELTLSLDSLGQAFIDRSLLIVSLGVLKALAIAALVVAAFHLVITRPLLRVHAAIAASDPQRPGQWPKPQLKGHGNDELGHLVESLDGLLKAFQHGLDQRDRFHQISTRDGLTGIANRRRFDSFLADSWQRAQRSRTPLSVILIDIDNFKDFNDHYGHVSGDDTLRAVASALTDTVTRATDLVARYGGEEFVCVLPETDLEGARRVAGRIREAILALGIPHARSAGRDRVTASLGVASAMPGEDGMTCEQLLESADRQLYHAKRQGRDRIASSHLE